MDVLYLPRKHYNRDNILSEEKVSYFDEAFMIDVQLNNLEGWRGGGDFMSKFGIMIDDTATFVVSRETFKKNVPNLKFEKPWAGDLIFFMDSKHLFEIKFVEDEKPFYEVGRNYTYEMRCDTFVYSHERFQTGIREIDERQYRNAYSIPIVFSSGNNVDFIIGETVQQSNTEITGKVSNWETRPEFTLSVVDIDGEFSNTEAIVGQTSGASYVIESFDEIEIPNDYSQNRDIENETDDVVNFDESNPFGNF